MATQDITKQRGEVPKAIKELTAGDIEKASALFNESALLAGEIETLALAIGHQTDGELPETITLGHISVVLENLAQKIGWMSDCGCKLLGRYPAHRGAAEEWLLPPIFHKTSQEM